MVWHMHHQIFAKHSSSRSSAFDWEYEVKVLAEGNRCYCRTFQICKQSKTIKKKKKKKKKKRKDTIAGRWMVDSTAGASLGTASLWL